MFLNFLAWYLEIDQLVHFYLSMQSHELRNLMHPNAPTNLQRYFQKKIICTSNSNNKLDPIEDARGSSRDQMLHPGK